MPGFEVIPAVDIRGGRCVRLVRGMPGDETVFSDDPLSSALRWQGEGATRLHVVDLDGAFEGRPVNRASITRLIGGTAIPVQVGGGIRDSDTARSYIHDGADRVIVGTAAFSDTEWLRGVALELGERLAVGLDVKEGKAATAGWTAASGATPTDAVRTLVECGVRRVVYTDVVKDGTLEGPDFSGIEELASISTIPLIASGGVSEIADIIRVSRMEELGVEGVIVGMALYRGRFTLQEALRRLEEG